MTYPVARLERVPQDGVWRTTREMNEYMDWRDRAAATMNLRMLALDGVVEQKGSTRFEWRRRGD